MRLGRAYLLEAQAHVGMRDFAAAANALRRGLTELPNDPELNSALGKLARIAH